MSGASLSVDFGVAYTRDPSGRDSLCALRQSDAAMEVLMVRRAADVSFVPGGFVFPGGTVEDSDRSELAAEVVSGVESAEMLPWVAAALRETFEETGLLLAGEAVTEFDPRLRPLRGVDFYRALAEAGIQLDGGRLTLLSNWVGPPTVSRRFDTRFFTAEVTAPEPTPDGGEVIEAVWVEPAVALARAEADEWSMIFPTRKHLELLAGFSRPSEVMHLAGSQSVVPIEPTVEQLPDGGVRLHLPDDVDAWWSY